MEDRNQCKRNLENLVEKKNKISKDLLDLLISATGLTSQELMENLKQKQTAKNICKPNLKTNS